MMDLRYLPGPMEGVMREYFVRAANELKLFPCWITPFFRFSDALPRTKHLAEFIRPFMEGEIPVTVQIMGTDPAILAAGAEIFAGLGAAGIDINCGCPSRQVTGGGAGGGMLRTPDRILQCAEAVKNAIGPLPLSIKMRTGFQSPDEMEYLLPRLASSGTLAFATVHFRTVREQYLPVAGREARWAKAVKLAAGLPLVLNGDMNTVQELNDIPARLNAAGAMSARGILRDPCLLRRAAGLEAPDAEEGRHIFYRTVRECAAGGLSTGQAIELTNFMWGQDNPYFRELCALQKVSGRS